MSTTAPGVSAASRSLTAGKLARHRARKRVNAIALTLSLMAMSFGLFWLAWILFETVRLGIDGLSLQLFTEMTPPPQAPKTPKPQVSKFGKINWKRKITYSKSLILITYINTIYLALSINWITVAC